MQNWQQPDSKLTTADEIRERIESIQRQIDKIDSTTPPRSSITFEKRHQKYAKLVSRLDDLKTRYRSMK